MRVLVTGAAGFIGSQVCAALTRAGHDVRSIDNLHPAAHRDPDAVKADRPDLVVGDLRDRRTVDEVLTGVDAVVHHAAMVGMGTDLQDMPEYVSCNDLGTAVLLAAMAARGVRRLVLASSMVVYGEGAYNCPWHGRVHPSPRHENDLAAGIFEPRCPSCATPLSPGLVDEDAPLDPRSTYAATKLAQENLATAWALACGGSATALRYHNVYGPGMPRDTPYAGVAAIFRSSLARGEAPLVFEDGAQRRDFVHVRDVAQSNVDALALVDPPIGCRPYNICSGTVVTIGSMATALSAVMGGQSPILTGYFRAGDVRHVTASPARAAAELGFAAKTTFEDGIGEFASEVSASRVGLSD
jgi:dTDP-L-rhamnose 4-epimerase